MVAYYLLIGKRRMPVRAGRVCFDSIQIAMVLVSIYTLTLTKIYWGNPEEFLFPLADFMALVGISLSLIFLISFGILFIFRRSTFYSVVTGLTCIVAVYLWAQANILNWDYGFLDGSPIDWNQFKIRSLVEGSLFLGLVTIAWVIRRKGYQVRAYVLFFLLITNLADGVWISKNSWTPDRDELYLIDESKKFEFSSEKNVIILVLDAFQGSIFDQLIRDTDEFDEMLSDFTWFKNASVSIASTKVSLPHMLSGIAYDNSKTVREFKRDSLSRSIITELKRMGFVTEYYDVFGSMLPVNDKLWSNAKRKILDGSSLRSHSLLLQAVHFRLFPQVMKRYVYQQGVLASVEPSLKVLSRLIPFGGYGYKRKSYVQGNNLAFSLGKDICCGSLTEGISRDVDFIKSMLGRVTSQKEEKVFKLYHLQGIHPPRIINKNFEVEHSLNEDRSTILISAYVSFKLLKTFLGELKKGGAYDNSILFIVSDHGDGFGVNVSASEHRNTLDNLSLRLGFNAVKGSAIPLLLFKGIYQKGVNLKTSMKPVSIGDIPNTISALVGGNKSFLGVDIFSPIDESRERLFWVPAWHERDYDFYGDLQEFRIKGDIYDDLSWSLTGRVLKPDPYQVLPPGDQVERKNFLESMKPLHRVVQTGVPFAIPSFGGFEGSLSAKRAFDNVPVETGWMPVDAEGSCVDEASIGVTYPRAFILRGYAITLGADGNQHPVGWHLWGSGDDGKWHKLHQVEDSDLTSIDGNRKIYYLLGNQNSYKSYKMSIFGEKSGECIFLDEVDFFENI